MSTDTPFASDAPLTPSQRDAIIRDDHTLIAAGAGSGKTTTLVDKILHALGADRVPGHSPHRRCELHEIAAITFTNAAAADLKRKLRRRLGVVATWHAERGDVAEAAAWRDRVYEVDRARIGTIHSFCGDILRDNALRIGMDPGFAVLDEAEASVLRDECVAAALDRALLARPSAMKLAETLGLRRVMKIVTSLAARPDLLDEIGDEWRDGHDALSEMLCAESILLAREARAGVEARLDDLASVDFDAMILETRDMLRGDAGVLAGVRRGLAWLFIDEFQDTDRAQLEIAYLISGFNQDVVPPPDAPPRDESECKLCIVGDPKQSIYRFRRADVSLWTRTERDFAARGIAPIALDTNFRSLAPIVGFVNATFEGLIGRSPQAVVDAGHDVPYAPLEPHRRGNGHGGAVELLVCPAVAGKVEARRAAESEHVVARMFEMVEGGRKLIWDDDANEYRAARWRDIAVLVRARTPLAALEDAFRSHGVPYYIASGDGFFARREIVDVRLLLTAVGDRHDDVAWLGLLRSPWIGLTDEAIVRARIGMPRAPISALLQGACVDDDRPLFERARTLMLRLSSLRDRVTVAELIDCALHESGYGAYVLAQSDGELAAMNLRKLVQIADGRRADTVSEFLDFLRTRESSAREGDAPLFTADEDVVTVTTVHSAKGLEWPIVVLVELGREIIAKRGNGDDDVFVEPGAGVGLKLERSDEMPTPWDMLSERDEQLTLAEEKRLWYVATTRARDRLILCGNREDITRAATFCDGTAEEEPKYAKDWLFRAIAARGDSLAYADGDSSFAIDEHSADAHVPAAAVAGMLPTVADVVDARATLPAKITWRVAAIPLTRSLPRYSATQLMLADKNIEEYRNVYVDGRMERRVFTRGDGDARVGVAANIMGDVLHGALERDRDAADLLHYIEAELSSRLGEDVSSTRVQTATRRLRELVDASRTNPVVARLYDTPASERELPFTWFIQHPMGPAVITGAMDLVAIVDDPRPEILDFKSHQRVAGREGATAATYAVQRDVYGAALAAVTGEVPARFTFFFPETGVGVASAVDEQSIATATATVRALIEKLDG